MGYRDPGTVKGRKVGWNNKTASSPGKIAEYGRQSQRRKTVQRASNRQAASVQRGRDAGATAYSVLQAQNKNFLMQALRQAAANGKAPGATPTDPAAGGDMGGGGGGGYGGGSGGFGPSAGQINADYMGQVAQVNQIGSEQSAKLKAIQDAYNAQAQAAVAGIRNDTSQLQGQFSGELAGLKGDLGGQGVQANPVLAAGTVQGQSLQDAQLRGSTFAQQLAMAQNANFADRAAGAATMQQGYLTDLAMQRQAALSGGGGGGGGGGGYGGGGGGGYGSDMPDYLKTKNLNSDLILGDKLAGEESTYRDWLRQQGHGAFKGRPLLQATLKDLRHGAAPDSLLARTNPNRRRVVGFLKQASKQYGGTRKASAKRRLRAAQRAKAAY